MAGAADYFTFERPRLFEPFEISEHLDQAIGNDSTVDNVHLFQKILGGVLCRLWIPLAAFATVVVYIGLIVLVEFLVNLFREVFAVTVDPTLARLALHHRRIPVVRLEDARAQRAVGTHLPEVAAVVAQGAVVHPVAAGEITRSGPLAALALDAVRAEPHFFDGVLWWRELQALVVRQFVTVVA